MKNLHATNRTGFIFILIFGALFGTVQAQVLEEIIVTAQKKEQELQNVGVSVSAFTGEQMVSSPHPIQATRPILLCSQYAG